MQCQGAITWVLVKEFSVLYTYLLSTCCLYTTALYTYQNTRHMKHINTVQKIKHSSSILTLKQEAPKFFSDYQLSKATSKLID